MRENGNSQLPSGSRAMKGRQASKSLNACETLLASPVLVPVKAFYFLVSNPSVLFLLTLTIFVFASPNIPGWRINRMAFFLLIFITFVYAAFNRRSLLEGGPILFPMAVLAFMAATSTVMAPYDVQTWSFLAAKFIVPFGMFVLARGIFLDDRTVRSFFVFAALVEAYLILLSLFYLLGLKELILPAYINDPDLGLHVERARGPFLQAVANGSALNMLGLILFYWIQKKKLPKIVAGFFIFGIPLAILSTMTRSVWLSFSASMIVFIFSRGSKAYRRLAVVLLILSTASVLAIHTTRAVRETAAERMLDQGAVDIRLALYEAGVKMFQDKPLQGWGMNRMPFEIPRYLKDYDLEYYWVHNTYLEIMVEQGLIGILCYLLIFYQFFKMGSVLKRAKGDGRHLIDGQFVFVWRVILMVYLINGFFVVLNYQFINALLFTLAGILSAAEARAKKEDLQMGNGKEGKSFAACPEKTEA